MAKKETEKKPVISFEKSIEVSDGDIEGVKLMLRRMRTTMSEKASKNGVGANLQTSEYAIASDDKIRINFKLKPTDITKTLSQTNIADKLKTLVENIYSAEDFEKLLEKNAEAIAYNIVRGTWLWRNRKIALDLKINIEKYKGNIEDGKILVDKILVENALNIPEISFDKNLNIKYISEEVKEIVSKVKKWIYEGLKGNENFYINITALLEVFPGEKVYPSELFIENKFEMEKIAKERHNVMISLKSDDSKIRLYYKNLITNKPAITADKLWNALRTYDVWYEEFEKLKEPISIEINGANLKYQTFPRQRTYDKILMELLTEKNNWKDLTIEDKMYFVACLIRGGVPN